MENKVKNAKHWYTEEEMKNMKKSDFYRENLAQHLGEVVVMDVPFYMFQPYKENLNRACFWQAKVVKVGDQILDPFMGIEHIWCAIKKGIKIDPRKPLRVVGIPYEYPHKCGRTVVKNVGLRVLTVTQNCTFAV